MSKVHFQYDGLIEEFKVIHKDVEALRSSGFNTTDIKKDIASMEEEREQLIKRVDRLKRKVQEYFSRSIFDNILSWS